MPLINAVKSNHFIEYRLFCEERDICSLMDMRKRLEMRFRGVKHFHEHAFEHETHMSQLSIKSTLLIDRFPTPVWPMVVLTIRISRQQWLGISAAEPPSTRL